MIFFPYRENDIPGFEKSKISHKELTITIYILIIYIDRDKAREHVIHAVRNHGKKCHGNPS